MERRGRETLAAKRGSLVGWRQTNNGPLLTINMKNKEYFRF